MKRLLDLEPGECRFPFGDRDFRFCAKPVCLKADGEESSYCVEHHIICSAGMPKKRAA